MPENKTVGETSGALRVILMAAEAWSGELSPVAIALSVAGDVAIADAVEIVALPSVVVVAHLKPTL